MVVEVIEFSMLVSPRVHKIFLFSLFLGMVFWFGRLSLQYELSLKTPSIYQVGEVNTRIPMVDIIDIEDGHLIGTVNRPEIRLKSSKEIAVPDRENRFELNIEHLGFVHKQDVFLKIPADALYVASKNGKYFYGLDEPTAKRLSPANRLFFATEQEATAAGYQKRLK